MQTHIVFILPGRLNAFHVNQVPEANQPNGRLVAYCQEELPQREFQIANYADWKNITQVHADTEEAAEAAAKVMSFFHPNKKVCIAKVSTVYTSKPSAPVAVTVNEKGMVPR